VPVDKETPPVNAPCAGVPTDIPVAPNVDPATILLLIVVVPVIAPTVTAVAAPAKLTVVAFVLTRLNVPVVSVIKLVVIVGLVPNTNAPLPVSSLITPANCADVVEPNWLKLPVVASVPLVGNVTLVLPDVVNEIVPVASVVKLAPNDKLPPSLTLRAALTTSSVTVRPAVKVVELVAATVTSYAALVSRIANPVRAVMLPPAIVGLVASTILPLPVVVLPRAVTVPLVGRVKLVEPLVVNVIGLAPLVVKLPANDNVPVVNTKLEPLPSVANNVLVPAGNVALVVAVVVSVNPNAPLVVKLLARSILPANLTVRAALTISTVSVRPAVSVVELVAAIVTSYAALVSRTANAVRLVMLPPAIVGLVARTTLPLPVEVVNVGASVALPEPVLVKNCGVVVVLPETNSVVFPAF